MRLQFHRAFTFDDGKRIVPYLAAMQVSHLYSSPILTARPGSMHGYDVVDPTKVSPELGGEPAFRRLVAALRDAGLGIIVDIVPNHMAIGGNNPWWVDVLRHGQKSRFGRYFDVDWAPPDASLRGKVLLPALGRPYGEALAAGEIKLISITGADRFEIRYFDHVFPIDPGDCAGIAREGLAAFEPTTPRGTALLHELLERQHFRLAWWRAANDEINWRRFFDINELAALRIEDDEVFEAVHARLFALYGEGLIDGVRIDHVDGLADPASYCRKLRRRLEALSAARPAGPPVEHPYIIVEKILGAGETLDPAWQCDGTTGYDFMNQVSALQHDPAGERPLGRTWHALSGRPAAFEPEENAARREMLDRSFAAQLEALIDALFRLASVDLAMRDFGRPALRRAVIAILVGMRVYRGYGTQSHPSADGREHLAAAVARARSMCLPSDRAAVELLGQWLAGDVAANSSDQQMRAIAIRRFHQLSAPLAAKAVEDTAFYRYGRLLSRIDVGFDASRFAIGVAEFHQVAAARREYCPQSLLATATHDHKRGEDVRARLAVLSEYAEEWGAQIERWMKHSPAHGDAPSAGDIAILFQTMVGAWPPALSIRDRQGCGHYCRRLIEWQRKALREAKLATDWSTPDEAYEAAARKFLEAIFAGTSDNLLLGEIEAFAHRIAPAGAVNGLAQVLLKLTVPGIPDVYQGTEFWDFSLVDPDNRRPVDFGARQDALLATADVKLLAEHWRDGRVKQAIIRRSLALRRHHPGLFTTAEYLPLETEGPAGDHVMAFARRRDAITAITVVPRFVSRLSAAMDTIVVPAEAWRDTTLRLPEAAGSVHNVLTGNDVALRRGGIMLADLLADLPVALLLSPARASSVS